MDSIYPVLSGALAQEKKLEVITNNLANVGTTGFKKDIAVFEGLTPHVMNAPGTEIQPLGTLFGADATFGHLQQISTDFSSGPIQVTGEPLDLAIHGEGFFAVQAPDGVRYTRNGHFTLDAGGQLVTMGGHPVLGSAGPINLPPGVVTIDAVGNISVKGGEAGATVVEIDVLPVFTVSNPQDLRKTGQGLFEVVGGSAVPFLEGRVQQGAIEGSNVNPVEEMVAMIEVMRLYEAAQKAMQTADEITAKASNEIGVIG